MNFESTITAITLSAKPMPRVLTDVAFLNQVQTIKSCTDYNFAFYTAIEKVQTPYFFFLDDDDTLPDNYLVVLEHCLAVDSAVAYTDELCTFKGIETVSGSGDYSAKEHIARPTMLHHLVLCKTELAKKTIPLLPKGQYWPEMPLYFQLAKESATYIPQIGYHWHRGNGLSSDADICIGQVRSKIWCARGGV